jgi:glycerophosphoryl diester phosphodiesterase
MSFLEHQHVLNIAHRGASKVAPPNTLAAFDKAIDLGADGIELDVHLSADGVPVVIHDFRVDATTDGTGSVADLTLAQLKQLDAGLTFDPAFRSERIPALEEVLDHVGKRLLLNIELKARGARDRGLERAVIALIDRYGLSQSVLLSSFNPVALRRAKRLAPHIPAGLLTAPDLPLPLRQAWLAPLVPHEARHPEHTMVNGRAIRRARRRGHRIHTWTVDGAEEMCRLITLGVDGIITNVPDILRAVIEATK